MAALYVNEEQEHAVRGKLTAVQRTTVNYLLVKDDMNSSNNPSYSRKIKH